MSINQLHEKRYKMIFEKSKCYAYDTEAVKLLKGFQKENIYLIKPSDVDVKCCFFFQNDNVHIWHKKLGHVNFNQLENPSKKNLVVGLPKYDVKCTTCLKNKWYQFFIKAKMLF